MASVTGSAISVSFRPSLLAVNGLSGLKSVALSSQKRSFPSIRLQPARFRVSCAAKPETVDKVCEIVKKQLALAEGTSVTGESKFSELGADSLDTVEIVMGIEEAFNITVEEDNAQSIATVHDAAEMVEKLITSKCA